MQDVLIVGAGPAGVSASLYAVRAGLKVTVLSMGVGTLEKAEKIENYYGFEEPLSGVELARRGIEGAKRLGVEFVSGQAVGLSWDGSFTVSTDQKSYSAAALLLATGTARVTPRITGLAEFEGKGVSYCAICDAFFYRGKQVAVLGAGEYALHEAAHLAGVAESVVLLTNTEAAPANLPPKVSADTRLIKEIFGDGVLGGVRFADGEDLAAAGLFVAYGTAGSAALARTIGAEAEGNRIVVDKSMATNIPGLWAAGDCVGGLLQIAKAAGEGAVAGTEMAKYVRSLKK